MYGKFTVVFYGKFDACANSVYQALSPPLKGPGDEASTKHVHVHEKFEYSCTFI